MELNREQIIKALECCDGTLAGCIECPNYNNRYRCKIEAEALTLIISQEQKIKELTQANEQLSESYDHLEKTKDELLAERSRLTEENEKLHATCTELTRKCASLTEENERLNKRLEKELLDAARVYDNYCRMIVALRKEVEQSKADTVRDMQERLEELYTDENITDDMTVSIGVIKQNIKDIAKELLEVHNAEN